MGWSDRCREVHALGTALAAHLMGAGEGRSLRKLEGDWLGPVHIEERPDVAHVVVRNIRSGFLKDPQARSRLSALEQRRSSRQIQAWLQCLLARSRSAHALLQHAAKG